jgi:ubiquinone/menaquinone biosynthesis C-methylase UbiE
VTLVTVRETFDRWAPFYNPTHAWIPGRRAARQALDLHLGDRVLDLACGTGMNLPQLRSAVGETGRVVGIDLSPRMLDLTRRLIAARRWQNVEAKEADAANLPFPDASFDAVLCSFALNIIPDYRRAVREVRRVLRPSGRFVSLEMRSGLHSLPWLWRPCAVDMSHDSVSELEAIFGGVQVRRAWMGMIAIASAVKEP